MTTRFENHPPFGESPGAQQNSRTIATSAEVVKKIAFFTSLLVTGLFAGFLTGVLVLEASLRGFPASVYTQVRHVELAHLDDLATVLLPAALAATATLVAVTLATRRRLPWPALAAPTLLVAAFVISAVVNVPINTVQHHWAVLAPPGDWAQVRDRWQIAHLLRTCCAVIAFAALAVAAPGRPRR